MKSTQYSDKVLDHFRNPRNVGTLEGKDVAIGRVGNPVCGDLMEIYIKVEENKIEDIKFKTFGCGSAIATASMITELAKGKTLEEAQKITRKDVANELDGLPPIKMHCSNLAADALRDAIHNYQSKQKPALEVIEGAQVCKEKIINAEKFLDRGVFFEVEDLKIFKDKRTLVMDRGDKSIELAVKLTQYTPRVVFITEFKEQEIKPDIRKKFNESNVKILYESKLLVIDGINEVEKVRIRDLNEDEEYELFVDTVIILI
jgi:FeS cluster assembly scaffold protein NifU